MTSRYKTPKPGKNFDEKTGKLYVFLPDSITVMKAWPPAAWVKTRSHPSWTHCRPRINLPYRNIEERIHKLETRAVPRTLPAHSGAPLDGTQPYRSSELALLKWYLRIPEAIRELAWPFPKRQWHLLSFLARCGTPASDLTISNPALAFALASNWVYHQPAVQRPYRSARALLRPGKKQKDILSWLGFPATESARKILTRLVLRSITISTLFFIRQALHEPRMHKALSHLSRLNVGSIRIITDTELLSLASHALLEDVAHSRYEDQYSQIAHIFRDCVAMSRMPQMPVPNQIQLQQIRSCSELFCLHSALIDDMVRIQPIDLNTTFPAPPVAGNGLVIPVTSARELMKEGQQQHNCVASYLQRIVTTRQVYIYHVLLEGEHCTLALTRVLNKWKPTELKGPNNIPASNAIYRTVNEWLTSQMIDCIEPLQQQYGNFPFD